MSYFRGSTVEFSTSFKDSDGAPVSPGSAVVTVSYPISTPPGLARLRASESIEMELSGADGYAIWNSSDASPGKVFWSIYAVTDEGPISDDGDFCLSANIANTPSTSAPSAITDEDGNVLLTEAGDTITSET